VKALLDPVEHLQRDRSGRPRRQQPAVDVGGVPCFDLGQLGEVGGMGGVVALAGTGTAEAVAP
jgi:hypothetical protein